MSILRAIDRAYRVSQERGWDRIYWSLDLHGTVLEGTYVPGEYKWISPEIPDILRAISEFDETHFILWSSLHDNEKPAVLKFFADAGISVFAVNENPNEKNTLTGNFDAKFYTSVIVDDKAGFDPKDWDYVYRGLLHYRERYGFDKGEKAKFMAHLDACRKEVATWPNWKQRI